MQLSDILALLKQIGKDINTTPWIVGGIPRDKILGTLGDQAFDLDITTGDSNIQFLASEFINRLSKIYSITHKQSNDGHVTVYASSLKIDFSSNFIAPHIVEKLAQKNITNPTDMQKEIYSRDFTCNSLLLDLDLKKIKDLTKQGIPDIKNKLIKTCLDPHETFTYNVNRIPRLIYLACKLNFQIDPAIIEWVSKNPKTITQCRPEYITKSLNKAITYNKPRTIELISELNLWDFIPITENIVIDYNNRLTKKSQFFSNFDYTNSSSGPGTGLYRAMDDGQVKSVSEFRKKRRNKRKKILKQIRDMKSIWKGAPK